MGAWQHAGRARAAGAFVLAYFCAMMCVRYYLRGPVGLYDALWGCNVAMLMAALGMLLLNRELLSTAVCVVAFPHATWLVDMAAYCATGKFPIGSAAYVCWDATPNIERITTTHHVWLIPLSLAVLRGNGGMSFSSVVKSWLTTAALAVVCYNVTPVSQRVEGNAEEFYLNVNMAHHFWKEIEVPFLHWFDPPAHSILAYQLWLNLCGVMLNSPFQLGAVLLSRAIEPARGAAKKKGE